jgi:transposase InsO family protein
MHWTNVYQEAVETVRACPECQRHNTSKRGYHLLTNLVAHAPFDHVTLDLAVPMPVTERENVYLLVLVDICTRYTILRAIPNKQSDTVVRTLVSIFGDYGFPKIISSDNGREFKNSLQHKIMENLGIERRYTTAYRPQADGSAESVLYSYIVDQLLTTYETITGNYSTSACYFETTVQIII